MWKALEASRYCTNNPLHKEGHADVNVAVRFLISARLAQGDPITMKRQTWFVASERHEEGGVDFYCRFRMLPPQDGRSEARGDNPREMIALATRSHQEFVPPPKNNPNSNSPRASAPAPHDHNPLRANARSIPTRASTRGSFTPGSHEASQLRSSQRANGRTCCRGCPNPSLQRDRGADAVATEATSNCPGSGPAGCQCQCHTHGCQDPPPT